MSYVSASGGSGLAVVGNLAGKLQDVVPGWGYASRKLTLGNPSTGSIALAVVAMLVGAFIVVMAFKGFVQMFMTSGFQDGNGIAWRGMGAAGVDTIRRSDGYSYPRSADKKDTFLNHGVGPEFVEQPNYLLGQEDMQRHALSKWNRLKQSGAAVSDWPTFWAAYKAENSDDLGASMYDFGSDGFKGSAKELQGAGLGR